MNFETLSRRRYSLRSFSKENVEPEKMNLILEAAIKSPTAANLQPQRLFVINSEKSLNRLKECLVSDFEPPAVIVVAYEKEAAWCRKKDDTNYGVVDASICASSIMLQAAESGWERCVWLVSMMIA